MNVMNNEEAMHPMNLPGFTAENSIYTLRPRYGMVTIFDSRDDSAAVYPAMPNICNFLAERVWGAYNEGAYNRGEFWLNVMESMGCFV